MNDDTFTELKDFINTTLTRQNEELRMEIRNRFALVDKKFGKMHRHLGYMQHFIGETFDTGINATDAVLTDHEARLFDLETDNDTAEDTGLFTSVMRQNYNIAERRQLVR